MEDETHFEIDILAEHDFRVTRTARGIAATGFLLGVTIAAKGIYDTNAVEALAGYGATASGLLPAYLYMTHKINQLHQEPIRELI